LPRLSGKALAAESLFNTQPMDARHIFIASEALLRKVEWERPSKDSEWTFMGEPSEVTLELIQNRIDRYFSGDTVYVVTDRHNSTTVSRVDASAAIRRVLEVGDATVCDLAFNRFMVFSRLGVVKQGQVPS
jgi:hypothetical protein